MPESKKKINSKKSFPVRLEPAEKQRLDGVLGFRGHSYQGLIENYLRWYETTGRTPWTETIKSSGEKRVLGDNSNIKFALKVVQLLETTAAQINAVAAEIQAEVNKHGSPNTDTSEVEAEEQAVSRLEKKLG